MQKTLHRKEKSMSKEKEKAPSKVKTIDEIEAKVKELEDMCKASRVPCSIIFVKDIATNGEAEYAQSVVTPVHCGVTLRNDLITPLLMGIRKGFKVVPVARADDDVFDPSELVSDDDEDEDEE